MYLEQSVFIFLENTVPTGRKTLVLEWPLVPTNASLVVSGVVDFLHESLVNRLADAISLLPRVWRHHEP